VRRHTLRLWLAALVVAFAGPLQGCATPTERAAAFADSHLLRRVVVQGTEFRHVVFLNAGRSSRGALHVYLEGDGSPYLDRWTVAPDPTPRNPLMLHLMVLDASPSAYVGRPCYFGLALESPCSPLDWTLGRFSERVVASLARAVEELKDEGEYESVEIYGHSGGGALAVLVAARVPGVVRVVTLAGNLDPDAWATLHGYTPLTASLSPVRLGPLPVDVTQLHVAGEKDRVVPPWMVQQAASQLGANEVVILPGVDHDCCWESIWPDLLGRE
jgi:pimeloyl-ACP methyl ester carboxylesterase